jgi:hypothetical protein
MNGIYVKMTLELSEEDINSWIFEACTNIHLKELLYE